jgi:ssDNA-binding Zn-finger/Zn-ribbon topoisomerase 1
VSINVKSLYGDRDSHTQIEKLSYSSDDFYREEDRARKCFTDIRWTQVQREADEAARNRARETEVRDVLRTVLSRKYYVGLSPEASAAIALAAPDTPTKRSLLKQHEDACKLQVNRDIDQIVANTGGRISGLESVVKSMSQSYKIFSTGQLCPICGRRLVERSRSSDGGKFIGCSEYPDCRFAWSIQYGATVNGVESKAPARETTKCNSSVHVSKIAQESEESDMVANAKTGSNSESTTVDSIVSAVVAATKEDGADAAWRTAADEATEMAKPVVKQILKEVGGNWTKPLIARIDTPIGTGAVAWFTGWAIMSYGPFRGKALGPKTLRLSKELRIAGLKPLTDTVAKRFVTPMRKRLTSLIEELPALTGEV